MLTSPNPQYSSISLAEAGARVHVPLSVFLREKVLLLLGGSLYLKWLSEVDETVSGNFTFPLQPTSDFLAGGHFSLAKQISPHSATLASTPTPNPSKICKCP